MEKVIVKKENLTIKEATSLKKEHGKFEENHSHVIVEVPEGKARELKENHGGLGDISE